MSEENSEITVDKTQALDAMLLQILNQALVAVQADEGSLMVVANKRGTLQVKARLGKPQAGRKYSAVYKIGDASVASWVVQNKQSYVSSDVLNDPRFATLRPGSNLRSLLSVPVVHEDKVVAVITADSYQPNHFSDKRFKTLEYIAQQVATSIAERTSLIDALGEIGMDLVQLPQDGGVTPVLNKIVQLALRSLGADLVILYQYNQQKDEFILDSVGPTIAGTLWKPEFMLDKVHSGDVSWVAVKERKSGFHSDIRIPEYLTRDNVRESGETRPRFVDREGIKSMAALLLPQRAAEHEDEEVVGVLFANYRQLHVFNIDEISALATFADYAAVAILNARREEQRRFEQVKMADSIAANFAHRMSNLAGTSGVATQVLREHIDRSNPLLQRQLDRIEHEATLLLELASRLVHQFRETGKVFELTPIDINELVGNELATVALETQEKNLKITPDYASGLPKVKSVEFQLRQVLRDILKNAVEALQDRESGKLTVRTRHNHITHRVEVEIWDNGHGIPEELRAKIFAPGVTTKKGSLGIGLWWCQTFMQATNGDVILRDTLPGEGTAFIIEIPLATGALDKSAQRDLPQKEVVDVLIVDDRPEWREQLKDVLEGQQCSVETAGTYAQAWHQLTTKVFKLAILDIKLKEDPSQSQDGLRLLADIDSADLDTKVIIVTGYGTVDHEQIARRSQRLLGFMKKDAFDVAVFRALVQQVTGLTRAK